MTTAFHPFAPPARGRAFQDDWYRDWLGQSLRLSRLGVFFVCGCQKSGTTWLQTLLNAHPNLCCGGEAHVSDVLAPLLQNAFNEYNRLQIDSGRLEATAALTSLDLHAAVRAVTDSTLWKYAALSGKPIGEGAGDTTGPGSRRLLAVGDKTPEYAAALAGLSTVYPNARFIHVIRDGRDGAVSGWAHLQRSGQAGRFATFADYAEYFAEHHWLLYITEARTAAAAFPERYLEIAYERLHANPLEETRRMLEFLGADSSDDAVSQCVRSSSFEALTGGRGRGQENRASHFRKGLVGDWRSRFDLEAAARFEAKAGPLLRELGYAA